MIKESGRDCRPLISPPSCNMWCTCFAVGLYISFILSSLYPLFIPISSRIALLSLWYFLFSLFILPSMIVFLLYQSRKHSRFSSLVNTSLKLNQSCWIMFSSKYKHRLDGRCASASIPFTSPKKKTVGLTLFRTVNGCRIFKLQTMYST